MSLSGSSSLSSLSPPPDSDDDKAHFSLRVDGAGEASAQRSPSLSSAPSSPKSVSNMKRSASPAHEEVLADNDDIAFIVMFRSRFGDAFPTKLPHFGPQDIERGVVDSVPSPQVEALLCALLALVLNRKKPIERGHYGRALEEAIQSQKSQWPRAWGRISPISGGRTFTTMTPYEKLTLLKTLIIWSLNTSELVTNMIKESYKINRRDDDLNQPLSVQPWGEDGIGRVYWLIEGQDDTSFRLYRETNYKRQEGNKWISIVGSIDELRGLTQTLKGYKTQAAERLSDRTIAALPRFEATEEKRKRREYRMARKAQFTRPEPGFSLYEGRTRGKRMRYTFSDEEEEEEDSDGISTRRSTRNTGASTPADPSKPTVTASGRHVRSRLGGAYGESLLPGQTSVDRASPATGDYERSEPSEEPDTIIARPMRGGKPLPGWKGWAIGYARGYDHIDGYNAVDDMDEDEDEAMSSGESGGEWDGGDENDDDVIRVGAADDEDEDDDMVDDESDAIPREPRSLIVTLRYGKHDMVSRAQSPLRGISNGTMPPQQSTPKTEHSANLIKLDSPIVGSSMAKNDGHHFPLPSRSSAESPAIPMAVQKPSTLSAPLKMEPASTATPTSLPTPSIKPQVGVPVPPKPWSPPVAPPTNGLPTSSNANSTLTNGTTGYRQQTLNDHFRATPSAPNGASVPLTGGSSAQPPVSGSKAPAPVTST